METLKSDSALLVHLKSGERLEARFLGLKPASIELEEGGSHKSYRREDVERIETFGRRSGSGKRAAPIDPIEATVPDGWT